MASAIDQEKKRQFGIYYTPPQLTESICGWAVRASSDKVLEPSFGGCVFLDYAARALRRQGATRPFTQLYGCDIDDDAFDHLRRLFPGRNYSQNFLRQDFLRIEPTSTLFPSFDAVIGNPPYVSNHNMPERQRSAARASEYRGILRVPATASLWAHFINHSLHFLREGGRVGMVLPGNAFKVDYGKKLLHQLAQRFDYIHVISLAERVFVDAGAREATTVLLCGSWARMPSKHAIPTDIRVKTLGELRSLLSRLQRTPNGNANMAAEAAQHQVTAPITTALQQRVLVNLGDIADVQIGVVTGANRFFILSPQQAAKAGLPEKSLKPIFGRMAMSKGITFASQDLEFIRAGDERYLLLDTRGHEKRKAIVRYLSIFSQRKRDANRTFSKRPVWHQPVLGRIPHAFLSYMNTRAPRLVLNTARVQSLNNIHRVYLKPTATTKSLMLAAISLWSTIGQLSAEIVGRSYGDGVLKLEPSEARRLPVLSQHLIPAKVVDACFSDLELAVRAGQLDQARRISDELLMASARKIFTPAHMTKALAWLLALRKHRGMTG